MSNDLARTRRELAAVLRWSARLRYQQGVQAGIAQGLADQVAVFDAYAEKHLAAIMRVLDREEPDYAN